MTKKSVASLTRRRSRTSRSAPLRSETASTAHRTAAGSPRLTSATGPPRQPLGRAVLDLIEHRPGARSGVSSDHSAGQGDEAVSGAEGRDQCRFHPFRHLGRLDVRYPETYHLWPRSQPLVQQLKDSPEYRFPAPGPVDRDQPAVAVEGQDRLHVEHAADPGLTSRYAPRSQEVLICIYSQENPGLTPDPLQLPDDLRGRPA